MAREAADRYFAALVAAIPFDTAPGDVDLVAACTDIQDMIIDADRERPDGYKNAAALHAGYLLGVEIGRRLHPV